MDSGEKFARDLEDRIKSRINTVMPPHDHYHGLIPGAIILSIGLVFLLNNLGLINGNRFWQFWPLLVIFGGIVKILDPTRRAWGAMIIAIGILLQLNQLGFGHFSFGEMWPLLLIGAGGFAMWSAMQARKITQDLSSQTSDPLNTLNEQAIFGGVEKRVNSKAFRGGQLQSLFGGIEIDLRDAEMAEDQAVLSANAVFGGIELRVPETWYVATRGQGIFGGYSDSTRYVPSLNPDKPKKTLVVMGTAIFGGVEIRN